MASWQSNNLITNQARDEAGHRTCSPLEAKATNAIGTWQAGNRIIQAVLSHNLDSVSSTVPVFTSSLICIWRYDTGIVPNIESSHEFKSLFELYYFNW